MEIQITGRGFEHAEFVDGNGHKCSIQQSSACRFEEGQEEVEPGASMLWLGIDDAAPVILASDAHKYGVQTTETAGWVPYPVPDEVLMHTRMHLTRKQAGEIGALMLYWAATGKLSEDWVE